ncbi:PQQ-binding-like beta-propeller repeat protein [Halosimplex aquaticum]
MYANGGRVRAIDAVNGSEIWGRDTGGTGGLPMAFSDTTLFVPRGNTVGSDAQFVALELASRSERWSRTMPAVRGRPTVDDDTIFTPCEDGALYALNVETGEERWRYQTGGRLRASPVVKRTPTARDDVVFFGGADERIYAVNARTGALLDWLDVTGEITGPLVLHDGSLLLSHDTVTTIDVSSVAPEPPATTDDDSANGGSTDGGSTDTVTDSKTTVPTETRTAEPTPRSTDSPSPTTESATPETDRTQTKASGTTDSEQRSNSSTAAQEDAGDDRTASSGPGFGAGTAQQRSAVSDSLTASVTTIRQTPNRTNRLDEPAPRCGKV